MPPASISSTTKAMTGYVTRGASWSKSLDNTSNRQWMMTSAIPRVIH